MKPEDMDVTLGIPKEYLSLHYKAGKDIKEIKRSYLERVAKGLADIKKWGPFTDILSLLVYGIILFPNMVDFVDSSAISVFWAVKDQGVDLVPALLADVF